MINECCRLAHFCSVIMHILFSGVIVGTGFHKVQWLHHQCELGGDSGILRFPVGPFRRRFPVNISSPNIISHARNK
jgi:hypothetical protein